MTQTIRNFLVIDDDPVNNFISKMVLKNCFGAVEINDFTSPESGLAFIESAFRDNEIAGKTILLLDINMPSMTGWQFLEAFQKFSAVLKAQFDIYILSSSAAVRDIERAKASLQVKDFIEKPLSVEKVFQFFG